MTRRTRMTHTEGANARIEQARHDPHFRAGVVSAGGVLVDVCARLGGRVVDVGYAANDHVVRELWLEGHMIGFRQSWAALRRLAAEYDTADPPRRIIIIRRENRREYPRTTPQRAP